MTFNDVLLGLLAHLRTENKPLTISWDSVQHWPESVLETFLQVGLLVPASSAQSIECHGCENLCFMDVITLPHHNSALTRTFIVCDDANMQSKIGRVKVPIERLLQWQASVKQLSKVIADLLGLKDKISFSADQSIIKLGMLKSLNGRRWVTLNPLTLSLEINQHAIPVDEILYFEDGHLFIDNDCIDNLLNRESLNQGKIYTPSTSRREDRTKETLAMYQDWNDEYFHLQKSHPTKSKTWCSLQIAKMDISKGRDSETIRRNIKS